MIVTSRNNRPFPNMDSSSFLLCSASGGRIKENAEAARTAIIWNEDRDQLPARSEPRHPPLDAPPADQLALALQFARAEKSPATCRAYRSDFSTLVLIDARHLLARAVFRAAIRRGGNND